MNYLKRLGKTLLSIIISITVLSILYYYNILGKNSYNVLRIIFLMVIFIINGYKLEKLSTNKFKCNIIFCILTTLLLLIFNLIFSSINYKLFIYILVIVLSDLFGALIRRSRKKN